MSDLSHTIGISLTAFALTHAISSKVLAIVFLLTGLLLSVLSAVTFA